MKAYELLEKPEAWRKGWFAGKENGIDCGSLDPEACSWCAAGAIRKAYGRTDAAMAAKQKLVKVLNLSGNDMNDQIGRWNDAPERTHAEVIALLKELDL